MARVLVMGRGVRRFVRLASMLTVMAGTVGGMRAQDAPVQGPQRPTFRSAVDLVSVTAVVRDRRGRVVRDLSQYDFEVFDRGVRRRIVDFQSDASAAVSVALLFDVSGSMQVASNVVAAQHAADHVLSWLKPGKDEAALYTFDTRLREMQRFTTDTRQLHSSLEQLRPFGATSLYDAIAETAKRVVERASKRRAVVVLTDGVDTASRLTPPEVSGIASSIDVPVYILAVVSPLDHPGAKTAVVGASDTAISGDLTNLAVWTGGTLYVVSAPAHASLAARELLGELRYQYLIAFESAGEPGWRPLEIRTRDKGLQVRARSGYIAGQSRPMF